VTNNIPALLINIFEDITQKFIRMKRFLKLTLFALVALITQNVFAQTVFEQQEMDNTKYSAGVQNVLRTSKKHADEVNGNPFLFEKWLKAKIILKDGTEKSSGMIKYDIYRDEFMYKTATSDSIVLTMNNVVKVVLLDADGNPIPFVNMNFNSFKTTGNVKQGFYQLLVEDKTSLISKRVKKLYSQDPYATNVTFHKFERSDDYYIIKDGAVEKVKRNKKFFLTLFADKQTEITDYLDREKIHFKDDKDLAKLVSYYNSLSNTADNK
jgi:hypothetical protein